MGINKKELMDEIRFEGYSWKTKIEISLFGNMTQTTLDLDGEKDEKPSKFQIKAVEKLIDNIDTISHEIPHKIFEYYMANIDEYRDRFGDSADTYMPIIESADALKNLVKIQSIYVRDSFDDISSKIGILFQCMFEFEHGLAIVIDDGEITDVGIQDIIL